MKSLAKGGKKNNFNNNTNFKAKNLVKMRENILKK